ncbi:putative nuclease HARBI1 [Merluccius polli]|uniref:Putative nuclease HARBI1 n=1 Tax=Merluccius polli TaxID=89951 RepID=A0AA47NZF1_MERPO|nr:putative nuclease HARBI1 [Merluccius polli]
MLKYQLIFCGQMTGGKVTPFRELIVEPDGQQKGPADFCPLWSHRHGDKKFSSPGPEATEDDGVSGSFFADELFKGEREVGIPVDLGARIVQGSLRRQRVFRDRSDPLALPEDILYERYRFSSEGIRYLIVLVGPYVGNATKRSCALTVAQCVCISLRFFATGTYMHTVGDAEHISKNTVCRAIRKVVAALNTLLNKFVVFPSFLPAQTVKEAFYQLAGFPKLIGAIDCTHVPLNAPLGEHEADFVNRKSTHSINVQMTCDHQLMVSSVDAKWPGSRIFRESSLGQQFLQGRYDGVIVGDRGYACMTFLMTSYGDPQTPSEASFNRALSTCRVKIEMTFGVMKARFNCLRGLRVKPERASQIITACVVLHNIATIRKERTPHVQLAAEDVVDPITIDHPTGVAVRQAITAQYFG